LIQYVKIPKQKIATLKKCVENRDAIPAMVKEARKICGTARCGDPIVIFHGGAVKDGFIVEVGFPVSKDIESTDVHTRTLESIRALTLLHHGPHQTVRETVVKIYDFLSDRAWTTTLLRREVYKVIDPAEPQKNITEVQVPIHPWDSLLAEGVEKVLGKQARDVVMQGIEKIDIDSSAKDYIDWIEGAMNRLDGVTDDPEKKCLAVSNCAHVFPQERIEKLRAIYQTSDDFDDLLREIEKDHFWYEKPVRKGNVLYMRKNPYDPDGYANGKTAAERRKAYCHCAFVHPYLLEEPPFRLSPTFCFCGAGWYRRLWEGIIGQPVKIEHVETLLRGNDQCTLTITLPLELSGEFHVE
jgi:effector-binding domain-containing protein